MTTSKLYYLEVETIEKVIGPLKDILYRNVDIYEKYKNLWYTDGGGFIKTQTEKVSISYIFYLSWLFFLIELNLFIDFYSKYKNP